MNHFGLFQRAVFDVEAHAGLYLVKTLPPGCAWINEEHTTQRRDAFDLQNMTVSADENAGRLHAEGLVHAALPVPRAAGDVFHPEREAAKPESLMLSGAEANLAPVDVSPDSPGWRNFLQPIEDFGRPHVAGMEDEVHTRECLGEVGMKISVRVGKNADDH